MSVKERIDELETSVNDCLVQIADYEARITGLRHDIEGMEKEIARLSTSMAYLLE